MTKEQEALIKIIKNQTEKMCVEHVFEFNEFCDKPITLKLMDKEITISEPRIPNNTEIREWFKSQLRNFHFSNPGVLTSQQYRSEKGRLRRGDFEFFIKFMKNRGVDITKDFDKFNLSKNFVDIHVTFSTPIVTEVIETYGTSRKD